MQQVFWNYVRLISEDDFRFIGFTTDLGLLFVGKGKRVSSHLKM